MEPVAKINDPCSQPWQDMTPEGNGRHCAHCSKIVTDFTTWSDEAILQYLSANSGVCGRFRKEQVASDETSNYLRSIARARVPLLHKIAAIFVLVFGLLQMSCNPKVESSANNSYVTGDSVAVVTTQTQGMPMVAADSATKGKINVSDSPALERIMKHSHKKEGAIVLSHDETLNGFVGPKPAEERKIRRQDSAAKK